LLCRGRRHVAEDAVAETFVRVYRVWSAGGVDDFGAYSRRALVNHLAGQARRDQVAARYLARQRADSASRGSTDTPIIERADVFDLLGRLPSTHRIAVVLRFYEDLSYEQIATELDLPVATAKSHVAAGLQRLRIMMAKAAPR
jgi:RNA polymerase sigma factor (sigma-70 family)